LKFEFEFYRHFSIHSRELTILERHVFGQLLPIFGNLDKDTIILSILDDSNNYEPLTEDLLLQRCLDDLLSLRTFAESTMHEDNKKAKGLYDFDAFRLSEPTAFLKNFSPVV
jgi:hypothetical protein